jgi:hypothetical protein
VADPLNIEPERMRGLRVEFRECVGHLHKGPTGRLKLRTEPKDLEQRLLHLPEHLAHVGGGTHVAAKGEELVTRTPVGGQSLQPRVIDAWAHDLFRL